MGKTRTNIPTKDTQNGKITPKIRFFAVLLCKNANFAA